MYRRPPLCDLAPLHAFGGHSFTYRAERLLRCDKCFGVISDYELHEGFMATRIGAWCPDALLALEMPVTKHVCEYCKGIVSAPPRTLERTIQIHLDSCPAAIRGGRKPTKIEPLVIETPKRKRIIPRQMVPPPY